MVTKMQECGFYRVIAQYGYRETHIKMEELLVKLKPFIDVDLNEPHFYLSSEIIDSRKDKWAGHRFFIKYFSMLHSLSFSNAKYFGIPTKNQIVLGERVSL